MYTQVDSLKTRHDSSTSRSVQRISPPSVGHLPQHAKHTPASTQRTLLKPNETMIQAYFSQLSAQRTRSTVECAVTSHPVSNISVTEVDANDTKLLETIKQLGDKWRSRGGNDAKSRDEHECAGSLWQPADVGIDVARRFAKDIASTPSQQHSRGTCLFASYEGDTNPIAAMELLNENAKDEEKHSQNSVYIRWLLGDPDRQGGGTALITAAKNQAQSQHATKIEVNAARTAVDWYKNQGFKEVFKQTHQIDGKHCGCVFMELDLKSIKENEHRSPPLKNSTHYLQTPTQS